MKGWSAECGQDQIHVRSDRYPISWPDACGPTCEVVDGCRWSDDDDRDHIRHHIRRQWLGGPVEAQNSLSPSSLPRAPPSLSASLSATTIPSTTTTSPYSSILYYFKSLRSGDWANSPDKIISVEQKTKDKAFNEMTHEDVEKNLKLKEFLQRWEKAKRDIEKDSKTKNYYKEDASTGRQVGARLEEPYDFVTADQIMEDEEVPFEDVVKQVKEDHGGKPIQEARCQFEGCKSCANYEFKIIVVIYPTRSQSKYFGLSART